MEPAEMVESLSDTDGKDVRLILDDGDEIEVGVEDANVLYEGDSTQSSKLEFYAIVSEDVRDERGWYSVGVRVSSRKERGSWGDLSVTAEVGERDSGQPEHERIGELASVEVLD